MSSTALPGAGASLLRWDVSAEDAALITAIVHRALSIPGFGLGLAQRSACSLHMDLTAVHRNIAPLRLQELLDTDAFNFTHDIGGIRRHLDRETGELGGCFVPRFARTRS